MRSLLQGGDRRSLGQVDQVVQLIELHPSNFPALIECLWDQDPVVGMRAADATEKISRRQPVLLQPFKQALLNLLAEATQPELRWHLAVVIPRLKLTTPECRQTAATLETYLADRSALVKTFAMQGLADLTHQLPALRPPVTDLLRNLTRTGTAAMRARGRLLLTQLEDH